MAKEVPEKDIPIRHWVNRPYCEGQEFIHSGRTKWCIYCYPEVAGFPPISRDGELVNLGSSLPQPPPFDLAFIEELKAKFTREQHIRFYEAQLQAFDPQVRAIAKVMLDAYADQEMRQMQEIQKPDGIQG